MFLTMLNDLNGFQWPWLVGCGGTEVPFVKNGKTYLYVWNAAELRHFYYCYQDDLFIADTDFAKL